jgi:hypothetical protein
MANQNGTEQVNEQWVMAVQVDEDAAKAFDALRDERAALDPDELVQINADIPTAATIALASFERLRPLRALVAKKLPEHEMKHWDALPSYALAALHAHLVSAVPADRDDRVERLLEEARPLREKLLVAAEAIAHAGVFDPDRVAQVRSGAGNVDRAADLVALCALYTERWAEVENRTMVTKEEVRRAGVLGPALLKAIGARDLASKRSRAELRLERARAFTLLIRAYESCQQAVAYVRFRARDADEYTPSLRPRPRARRPTSQEPRAASPAAAADHRFRSRGRAERRRRCGLQRASARGARAGLVAGSGERAALSLPLEAGRDPASEQQAPSEAGGVGRESSRNITADQAPTTSREEGRIRIGLTTSGATPTKGFFISRSHERAATVIRTLARAPATTSTFRSGPLQTWRGRQRRSRLRFLNDETMLPRPAEPVAAHSSMNCRSQEPSSSRSMRNSPLDSTSERPAAKR